MSFNYFLALLKITRPLNVFITYITSFAASLICLQEEYFIAAILYDIPVFDKIFMAALTAALTAAAGNIINDIADVEGDKINHPERPLPSGTISINTAVLFYLFLSAGSLTISAFISLPIYIINAFVIIILFFYANYFKRIPLAGNILVSFLTGLVFIYGGLAVNQISLAIIPAVFAFLINLIREIVKDIQDIEGDVKEGIVSFAAKSGIQKTRNLVNILSAILIVATGIPLYMGLYNFYYGLMIFLLVDPILLYFTYKLNRENDTVSLKKLSSLLKLNMILGLIAVYIGS